MNMFILFVFKLFYWRESNTAGRWKKWVMICVFGDYAVLAQSFCDLLTYFDKIKGSGLL